MIRVRRGWSQAELARRAGISRTAVTAIEGDRLVPSVAAALSLASALDTTVEALFGTSQGAFKSADWAWEPASHVDRYWEAEVGGRRIRFPAESQPMLTVPPDGLAHEKGSSTLSNETLVLATCDPAAGLLASLYAASTGLRLLVLQRSSGRALELLRSGLVHLAGLHLSTTDAPGRNAAAVVSRLGAGYELVRLATWQAGIAVAPSRKLRSVQRVVGSRLSWVGRETGSAAREFLDQLLDGRPAPRRMAGSHRQVADAVQSGWADAGVCVRLASDEAGLDFLHVRDEVYEVCYSKSMAGDLRIKAFLSTIRSSGYRNLLGRLPGYDTRETGTACGVSH